ncbi:MAG: hypothetical protein H6625_13460 [Bdellovibrionaceae bacterium]|nr:hypothetical protein [Pseudobdellovibrionaceae bacterium]
MKKENKIILLGIMVSLITACGSPDSYYEDAIKKEGYIPFSTPLASAGVGTIIQGGPEALRVTTRPERCFPNHMGPNVPTQLRWVTDTNLPSSYESFQLGFGVDLANILAAGNPLVNLNLGYNQAKNVKIEFDGASIEYLDEAALYYYYLSQMGELCREFLKDSPFILQALRIEKMKFSFFNSSGVQISLSPGTIGQIMSIGTGVKWSIEKGQSLSINSPKYIGYQVGFMNDVRPGRIGWYAYKTKNNEFDFQEVKSLVPVNLGSKEQYLK